MRPLLDPLRRHGADLVLALLALAAASPWLGRRSASFDLVAQFLLQATLATLALLLVLVAMRRWWRALLAASCLAAQLVALQPTLPRAAAASPMVRVVSLNLWVDNPDRPATIAYLRETKADVLVLSEIYGGWREAIGALADLYPHRVDCLDYPGCDVAILSRAPMLGGQGKRDHGTAAPYVEASIAFGGRPLLVAGTHLVRPLGKNTLADQVAQVRFVGAQLARQRGPRLLVGDFNGVPWARVVGAAALASGLDPVGNIDGTWPARAPWPLRIPIDNLLASGDVEVTARRTGPAVGSDHRPVVIYLRLPGR